MKRFFIFIFLICAVRAAFPQDAEAMWGSHDGLKRGGTDERKDLFDRSNYAMFIHWGLYSQIANKWKGKTFYGISEWIMSKPMAGIPVDEYKEIANSFNPAEFDARAIAQLAKDAGMKYIVFTAKHHDGFAMYDSKACDFNIANTPFGRDPMRELSEACRDLGLGFGFYYSHNKDWTYPGGNGEPAVDEKGNAKTFDDYFKEKCLPQVEEITRNYGEIQVAWFDTPGNIPEEYVDKILEIVRRNQPKALISGRVGYGKGDYNTLGDMEIPLKNMEGLWESIDVTNDSWGYTWYDKNWKSPKQVLFGLISTVGRGGTFMLNVGPDSLGRIPQEVQWSLRAAGKWIGKHSTVVYDAGASPWGHALPWGDVTVHGGKLRLALYRWPATGKLYLPGVQNDVERVKLHGDKHKKLGFKKENSWLVIELPFPAPDKLVNTIEVESRDGTGFKIDPCLSVDPEFGIEASAIFGKVHNGKVRKRYWMEKFGEWKTAHVIDGWQDDTAVTWDIAVKTPGLYLVSLEYAGKGRVVWTVEDADGQRIENEQGAVQAYETKPIGWMKFDKSGKQQLTVRLKEGDKAETGLTSIKINPIIF